MKRRKCIGYFEGTDSGLLTSLICDGHDTIPVSNGYDNHGKHIRLVNEDNKFDLLIGYAHKLYAPVGGDTPFQDVFHICRTYRMPMLIEVPKELHEAARKIFTPRPRIVKLVDPANSLEAARKLLAD